MKDITISGKIWSNIRKGRIWTSSRHFSANLVSHTPTLSPFLKVNNPFYGVVLRAARSYHRTWVLFEAPCDLSYFFGIYTIRYVKTAVIFV